jgi:hypothetical protein
MVYPVDRNTRIFSFLNAAPDHDHLHNDFSERLSRLVLHTIFKQAAGS